MELTQAGLSSFVSKHYRKRKAFNYLMCALLVFAAAAAIVPLLSVFLHVIKNGASALNPSFFTELPKPVGEEGGGVANALLGTGMLVALASLIGIPWGIAIALYLSEYARGRMGTTVRFSVDLLSSVPSIIIGLFVYALVVVTMKHFSVLAGGIALGILMVPTVARSSEALLKLVPIHIREAGLALGLPRWKVILWIVLKGSRKGILTGVMLAVARVAGETAPLLFTAFNNQFWNTRLDQPVASLPVQIYTYAISPFEDWHAKAWASALILVLMVFVMNILMRLAFGAAKGARE